MMSSISLAILLSTASSVIGHGMVLDPPGRATAWRYGFRTPVNYDDNGLNCGGVGRQWARNGGKCGLCGEPYDTSIPRRYEYNGRDYRGVIVATYLPGSPFQTTTRLTAYHKGFWEFRLCTNHRNNTQECFNQHILELKSGGPRYYPKKGSTTYYVKYKLPALTCDHCVLQWRYVAGNSWGRCPDGRGRLGCGPQEEFRGCSDIAILP
ncbi:uncharacterized protein LOC125231006 [Leguminivora glycinivorella]|uniref:uncharacterized protein LOC125231006 n=1 Tax=Leguminivora glycinivorella TaxID=1035111 RepID=UPI002010BDDA|nr:uncharacterized protein LOC125231006 [Leguminivora glycinivorella]